MCSRSLEITGVKDNCLSFEVSALFPFLNIAVMFASFHALGTCPEATADWKISCIIGVRWETSV